MDKRFEFSGARKIAGPPELWAHGFDDREGAYPNETIHLLQELECQFDKEFLRQCGCELLEEDEDYNMFGLNEKYSTKKELYDVCNDLSPNFIDLNLKFVNRGYVANAADSLIAAARGGAKRALYVEMSMAAKGGSFTFDVRDNGTGVDPEVKGGLFDQQFESDKKGKEGFAGKAGMHLFHTKAYIDFLGGEAGYADYGKSRGARFFYSVPVANILADIARGKERMQQTKG